MPRNNSKKAGDRSAWVLLIFAVMFVSIIGRLTYFELFRAADWAEEAVAAHQQTTVIKASRGTIYDRAGQILAVSVRAYDVAVDPSVVNDADVVADLYYEYLGEELGWKRKKFYAKVTTEGTQYVVLGTDLDYDKCEALSAALSEAGERCGIFTETTTRVYPNGSLGSQVVGGVNSEGDGYEGMELYYNELLSGTDGSKTTEVGANGVAILGGESVVEEAVDGEDIVISLDIKLQQKVEKTLLKQIKAYSAEGGSATILDASTGEIYAAVSFTKTTEEKEVTTTTTETTEDGDEVTTTTTSTQEVTSYGYDSYKLWSVTDAYEPGSTMKIMSAAAILENGGATANTSFTVPYSYDVYDHTITDSHTHATEEMTLTQIITESSNVGIVKAAQTIKLSQLYSTFTLFGFGSQTGVDFNAEADGTIGNYETWDGVQRANVNFGQGITVTALQLVRAYAAVANSGVICTPHFLTELPHNTELDEQMCDWEASEEQIISESTAATLTKMMRNVVTSGTGTSAAIEGYEVVGKTGTAEKVVGSTYSTTDYIVSFCGWIDGVDSDLNLVCLITIDSPQTADAYGGSICGPVFSKIMTYAIQRYSITTSD